MLVAVLQVLVVTAAAAALPGVRERAGRLSLSVGLDGGTVALRGRGTEGFLRLRVSSDAQTAVELGGLQLTVAGSELRGVTPPAVRLRPGRSAELTVRYAVRRCRLLGGAGELRLTATADDGARGLVALPVADVVASGCRDRPVPGGVAVVGLRTVGSDVERADDGLSATGAVELEVVSYAAPVRLVAVAAEVPGALLVGPTNGPPEPLLAAGDRRTLRLPFTVPFCPALRPRGQVTVTVREPDDGLRRLSFAVAADGEARLVRDVDLSPVLGACTLTADR